MKTNIIKSILMGGLIIGATSCNDFLDQTSPSEHDRTDVFDSPYYTGLALNKVYGQLTEDAAYAQVMAFTVTANSDCEIIDGIDASASTQTSSERGVMNYNAVAGGWSKITDAWDKMYQIIENCNNIVYGVDHGKYAEAKGSDATSMKQYKAEALVIRAMCYYDLVKNFGDVPFKTDRTDPSLNNAFIGKTDRDVIMESLITDLQNAAEILPWAGTHGYTTEHVTKGYAHALCAQIAMQRAGWAIRETAKEGYETAAENSDPTYPTQRPAAADRTKFYKIALQNLNEVINSGVHKLNPSFENEWYLVNQRKLDTQYQENLFEIPMGLNKSGERGYTVGVRVEAKTNKYGPKGNSSGKIKTTAPLFWSFDKKDTRRDITCVPYQIKNNGGLTKETFDSNKPFELYIGKWDVRKMTEDWRDAACASTEKVPTGINEIKMRYSQVLLNYAECINELNGGPDDATGGAGLTARQALAQVHTRAFAENAKSAAQDYVNSLPTDKEGFFNAIVDENAWEFTGEGVRKFDLERWNLLSSKIDEFKAKYQEEINEYPDKLYYKEIKDEEGNISIDMNSVCWYAAPSSTSGYKSANWWGAGNEKKKQENLLKKLPYISAGLNTTVKNRYLLPIATSTIADSRNMIQNSYGF